MVSEAPIWIGEAAALTGLHPDTLRRYIANGVLKAVKTPSGERRVYRSALEKLWHEPKVDDRQAAESRAIGRKFFEEGKGVRLWQTLLIRPNVSSTN